MIALLAFELEYFVSGRSLMKKSLGEIGIDLESLLHTWWNLVS
jgi:hypothetical protein